MLTLKFLKKINDGENANDVKIISTEIIKSFKRLINFVDKFKIKNIFWVWRNKYSKRL